MAAAAGAAPAAMGGTRRFMGDPQESGLSTAVGDLAAINLQLIHFVRGVLPDADRALVDGLAAQTRQVLAASDAGRTREATTRELRPITRVPDTAYGVHTNVAAIRMNNVTIFTGLGRDPQEVVRWQKRILGLAQGNTLSFEATINLMIQGSSGGASDYIEQMREEGKSLHQIVQLMEMRYGDLCIPEEARVKCNNMIRLKDEGLPEFIDRLRWMAGMACRMENDDVTRRADIDMLIVGNIRRVLPHSVRITLEERILSRSAMGLPAFTARELEKECLDLERRRIEIKKNHKNEGLVNLAGMTWDESDQNSSDTDSTSSEEGSRNPGEATEFMAKAIQHQQRKYFRRGMQANPQEVYRKAVKKYNKDFFTPRFKKRNEQFQRAQQAMNFAQNGENGQQRPKGPPNFLDKSVKRTLSELLTMSNCQRGSCIQCGKEGHYMHNEACALRDKPLTDRPCFKCGHGLHAADDCLVVYQTGYRANPLQHQQPALVNLTQDEGLKEK